MNWPAYIFFYPSLHDWEIYLDSNAESKSVDKHKCDKCEYQANTLPVLKRHKTMKHKQASLASSRSSETPANAFPPEGSMPPMGSTSPPTNTGPSSPPSQPPILCAREDAGCKNLVNRYYNIYTAICPTCKLYLQEMMKLSPFPPSACPCCHETSEGPAFSFCQECIEGLYQDGFMESGWGSWHLDKNIGEIICTHLDFE